MISDEYYDRMNDSHFKLDNTAILEINEEPLEYFLEIFMVLDFVLSIRFVVIVPERLVPTHGPMLSRFPGTTS